MAITDFDFRSPGVQIREEDQSTFPVTPDDPGIVIIGNATAGPSMQPVIIRDKEALERIFGSPQNTNTAQSGDDVYRYGSSQFPTYGLYAAKAWLSSGESPVTFIRLAGNDNPEPGGSYTYAGWELGGANLSSTVASNVSAYGVFIMPSASAAATTNGTLAAVIYTTGSAVALSGTIASDATTATTASACTLIKSIGNSTTYNVAIFTAQETFETFEVDFSDPNSVRAAINTNPQKIRSINHGASQQKGYFLGESYEESVDKLVKSVNSSNGYAFVAPIQLNNGAVSTNAVYHRSPAVAPKSGWIFSRDPNPTQNTGSFQADQQTKLFKVHSLHEGTWMHGYHIKISDLNVGSNSSKRSTFTLSVLRGATVVERYANLNLDSTSENFVARRIGDTKLVWNNEELVFDEIGQFANKSKYIRIEQSTELKAGISDELKIPFGFFGPARPKGFTHISGSAGKVHSLGQTLSGASGVTNVFIKAAGTTIPHNGADAGKLLHHTIANLTASFVFPSLKLTEQNTRGSAGSNYSRRDVMGVRHTLRGVQSTGDEAVKNSDDYLDLVKYQVWDVNADAGANTEYSFVFSMDDLRSDPSFADSGNTNRWYWQSGSHAAGTAYTAVSGSRKLTQRGPTAFSVPLFGGFNGVDITHLDPFSMENVIADTTAASNYAHYSIKKALDMVRDDEQVPTTLISFPGLTNSNLLVDLKEIVEDRADCLGIIDFKDDYKEPHENNGVFDESGGTVNNVLDTSQEFGENMNSNRMAVYFPRVKIQDGSTEFIAPPSVAAIGALAFNDANSAGPWFAPAGFNRGGLSSLGSDASGLSVINTKVTLTKKNRDELYEEHINPIAKFPALSEIVIFGQKTLARAGNQTTSALSRVNVRRLMIYLYHKIKNIADTTLFEQSVRSTFTNFTTRVERVLNDVKSNFGITEYLVELDETATDESGVELRDRNIMYVKVFIKPARAIEFIAIDFVITRSNAEF